MSLDSFWNKVNKEEINPNSKYPIIWKIEKCFKGECKSDRVNHRLSVPFTTPMGLVTECYDCHNTKQVTI